MPKHLWKCVNCRGFQLLAWKRVVAGGVISPARGPDCKNIPRLSERRTPLSIMGAPLKPLDTIMVLWCSGGFSGGTQLGRIEMTQRDASLSGRYTPSLTHRETFSKSYRLNPKSDCIYDFPIYLDPNERPFGCERSENGKYNLIPSWFNKISKRLLRV